MQVAGDNSVLVHKSDDNVTIKNQMSDGAFGLTQKDHAKCLCSREKYYRELYRHLIKFHKLTVSSIEVIRQAIQNNENPFEKTLFQLNDIVIDQINHLQCPFSIHNDALKITHKSPKRYCRTVKPQLAYSLLLQ
ncbi:unnamed protein product [Rotaria sordida]|uniref:Uncharacterized protein n=1 Tax=Rotaria sordida TaxID=392033 RepID=A0A818L2X6_9BILA|nr:unnamed protein product [Rotaria sordida]